MHLIIFLFLMVVSLSAQSDDKFSWLEDIESDKSMSWVKEQNSKTLKKYTASLEYKKMQSEIQSILEAKDKITYPKVLGQYVYNFWQDSSHVRGILRRKSQNDFDKDRGSWETILDIDALAQKEGKSWVYKGMVCLYPEYRLCMMALSDGGTDAVEYREFDMQSKGFVPNGFKIPEAKTVVSWRDKAHLFVATNFSGSKNDLTDSGYPRMVKVVKRGQSLSQAKLIYSTDSSNIGMGTFKASHGDSNYDLIFEHLDFFRAKYFKVNKSLEAVRLDVPEKSRYLGFYKDYFLFKTLADVRLKGESLSAGSLVAVKFSSFGKASHLIKLFTPSSFGQGFSRQVLKNLVVTKEKIILSYSEELEDKLQSLHIAMGTLSKREIYVSADQMSIDLVGSDLKTNKFYYTLESFIKPTELHRKDLDTGINSGKIQSLPQKFSASQIEVQLKKVTSPDGTEVPYYIVGPKGFKKNAKNKTLLYGYGGFEVSMEPHYSSIVGKAWLEEGHIYVLAAIRGGGEYGPGWHEAAIQKNKQKSYDDFIAVAQDLIKQKITSPKHLAIEGGSNGGLLVGAVSMQKPELFAASVCQVPLLDMKRYHHLLAGASWMAEYGNPDLSSDWSYIKKYSPYQNLDKNKKKYPKFLFYTSTKDDRVHPGHARKMAAKMQSYGLKNIYFFENTEGGHAASANLKQRAKMWALTYSFLKSEL